MDDLICQGPHYFIKKESTTSRYSNSTREQHNTVLSPGDRRRGGSPWYFPGRMKQLRMVYLGNLKTFIINIKTKYNKSVLGIVC